MDDFDLIETYDGLDETLIFGTRCEASGNNLHESITLCVLKSSVKSIPDILSMEHLAHDNKLYLSSGKIFRVFSNPNCTSIDFQLKVEAHIDTFCVAGDYVLICVRNGTIHLYNKKSLKLIFTGSVVECAWKGEKYFIKCFHLPIISQNIVQFLLVSKNGSVFRITFNCESNENVEYGSQTIIELNTSVSVAALSKNNLFLNGEKRFICKLDGSDNILQADGLQLKSVYPYSTKLFIALTEEGKLVYLCGHTLLVYRIPKEDVFDNMVFYHENNKMCFVSCKMQDKNNLKLLNFPDFTEVYSLEVNDDICLVHSANQYDEQLYISKLKNEQIRIQKVTETSPEMRLERLLRKQLFDEAETFAKSANLNMEDVMKAKAEVLMETNLECPDDIDQLINILDSISDIAFKLKFCLNISCDNLDSIRKILNYGLSLDIKKHKVLDVEFVERYFCSINEEMYRFETFLIISRCNKLGAEAWHDFCSADPYTYLIEQLKCRNIEMAITMYARLDVTKIQNNDILDILDILEKIPLNMVTVFLQAFIPKTLNYIPTSLPLFIQWICRRVFHIEKNDCFNFPDNAAEFLHKMVQLLSVDSFSDVNFEKYHTNCKDDLDRISNIMKSLKTIDVFKNSFNLIIPLEDCLKGPVSLVHALLCIETIDLNESLMNFLVNFLAENQFEPDTIFINVIDKLLPYEEKYWINVIPPIWRRINSIEVKLNSLKYITKAANLPWCSIIRDMFQHALSYNHILVSEIECDIKMEPLYIVLSNPMYNLKHELIDSLPDMFAIQRVIYCNVSEEDAYTLCLNQEMRTSTTIIFLLKYTKKCDIVSVLRILNILKQEDIIEVMQRFYNLTRMLLEDKFMKTAQKEAAVKITELLQNRSKTLSSSNTQQFEQSYYEDLLQNMQTVMMLEKKYGLIITLKQLKKKETILEDVVMHIVQDYQDKKIGVFEVIHFCNRLQSFFSFEGQEILLKLCMKLNDTNFIYNVCAYIYEHSEDFKSLCTIATLIMDRFRTRNIDLTNGSSDIDIDLSEDNFNENSIVNLNLLKQCLSYGKKCASKATLLSPVESAYETLYWSSSFDFLSDTNILDKHIYQDNTTMLNINSIEAICNTFSIYMKQASINKKNTQYLQFINTGEEVTEESLIREIQMKIPLYLQNLCTDGNYLTSCNLITSYINSLCLIDQGNTKIALVLKNILMKQVTLLLEKVFSATHIDKLLAFNLLLIYPYEKAYKLLKQALMMYKRDPDKFVILAEIGIKLSEYHKVRSDMCFGVVTLGKWWKLINPTNVPYKDFFTLPKEKLLENLIRSDHFTIEYIHKFCKDLKIDAEQYYKLYLKVSLINWKPDYNVQESANGQRIMIMNNDEKQLFKKCEKIINMIKKKESVFEYVYNLWETVSVYHYEVFMCILNILSMFKEVKESNKKNLLLQFLQKYTRVNKPSPSEMEEWFTKFPDTRSIDAISEWRLPFTSTLETKDIWNILRPEVKLYNYILWFETLPILNQLTKDDICSYVIKEVISSGLLKTAITDKWILHSQFNDLFAKIDSCIQHMSSLERASSVAYHLMIHTPQGADQVTAAKLSYKYAKKFKESSEFVDQVDNHKAFVKVEMKYYCYSVMHILHTNNLANEKYLNLSNHPDDLIEALYSDKRIVQRVNSVILNCPDINKAVDEIAELHNINIEKKRIEFLDHWLSNGCSTSENMDETVYLSPIIVSNDDESIFLKKASYICLSGDVTYWRNYLWTKGAQKFVNNNYYEARAYQCLCAITPVDKVEEITESPYDQFLYYINQLLLLHDLQCLGMNITIEQLKESFGKTLLKKLSKNAAHPLNLKVMASICICYQFYDVKYWELIINNVIKLELFTRLKTYINLLKDKFMLHKPFYISGWQNIIDYEFSNLPDSNADNFNGICILNMHLIQSCPVLHQINLENVFFKCLKVNRSDLAVLLLQYISTDNRVKLLQRVLENHNKNSIIMSVQELYSFGLHGTSYVIDLIKDI